MLFKPLNELKADNNNVIPPTFFPTRHSRLMKPHNPYSNPKPLHVYHKKTLVICSIHHHIDYKRLCLLTIAFIRRIFSDFGTNSLVRVITPDQETVNILLTRRTYVVQQKRPNNSRAMSPTPAVTYMASLQTNASCPQVLPVRPLISHSPLQAFRSEVLPALPHHLQQIFWSLYGQIKCPKYLKT